MNNRERKRIRKACRKFLGMGRIRLVKLLFCLYFPLNLLPLGIFLVVTWYHFTWTKWAISVVVYFAYVLLGRRLYVQAIKSHPLYYLVRVQEALGDGQQLSAADYRRRFQALADEEERSTWRLDDKGELIVPDSKEDTNASGSGGN